ncbi:PorT family protein [Flavobacterium sp. J49]|uniref:porin family protein n=1 Tax=Flavobacterium sp. J49 TaxID=2718534 RepID=UPI001593DB25|nr:porin family protein [Flavobacterium sp. J49]MBF6641079.1 PorT family protein [Flavobacterium sp. J49]NIC02326.1 PorT family protein [Flavobacterium sp. J49]
MKKVFLTMAAVFAVSFANAQDKGGSSDMKFGVKAGFVSANYGSDADGGDARSGFYLGGLVDFAISEKFHVQPELLYTMEGNGEEEFDLNFLRIPIMAKYYVAEGFNLQAGPQIAFVAGGGAAKDYLKSMDFGLGIGAGYELESGLFFDARYNLGLSDLNDFPAGSLLEGAKITQNSFNVGLGYRF